MASIPQLPPVPISSQQQSNEMRKSAWTKVIQLAVTSKIGLELTVSQFGALPLDKTGFPYIVISAKLSLINLAAWQCQSAKLCHQLHFLLISLY